MEGNQGDGVMSLQGLLTLLALIGTGIAFMFSKQTMDALITFGNWWMESREKAFALRLKYRKQVFDEEEHKARMAMLDEELNDKGHKYVIRRQDRRITELENNERICQEKFVAMSTKYDLLEEDNQQVKNELVRLRQRLEILAPGISSASDSKVARYFERFAKMRGKNFDAISDSGDLDVGENK